MLLEVAMRNAFTIIELIIVIIVVGIMILIAIPNVTRSRITANESTTQQNLQIFSAACENFATNNHGDYPTSEAQLTGAAPPYLSQSFCGRTINGYTYSCSFTAAAYSVDADADGCGSTGSVCGPME